MARPRRSKGVEGSPQPATVKEVPVKLKLAVSREVARLLKLEAFGRDVSLGRVVEDLVKSSPRRFVLVDRARGAIGAESPRDLAGEGPPVPLQGPPTLGVVSEAG